MRSVWPPFYMCRGRRFRGAMCLSLGRSARPQHDRLIGERGGDRSDVASELLHRVSLDLGRNRAAAIPTHVERGKPIPVRQQKLDLVVPGAQHPTFRRCR